MPSPNLSAIPGVSTDERNGTVRSFFDPHPVTGESFLTEDYAVVAADFLATRTDWFQLDDIAVAPDAIREGLALAVVRYRQMHLGIPVFGGYLNVGISRQSGTVVCAVNRLDNDLASLSVEAVAKISAGRVPGIVRRRYAARASGLTLSRPLMCFYRQQLVWRVGLDARKPLMHLDLMVDASTGAVLEEIDRRRFYATCRARIFWPDPVTSSGNPGIRPDSPVSALEAEMEDVLLENLDESNDRSFRLRGRWVRLADREAPATRLPASRDAFLFSPTDPDFLGVMSYYYLDRLVEWLQQLDIPAFRDSGHFPIEVDPRASGGDDNSYFVAPATGPVYLAFGEGGTPDASDPGVIVHEFGHAIHYFLLGGDILPGWCEEGFGDFLSCVFRDRFNRRGYDRPNPFPWDNHVSDPWDPDRRCDVQDRFDDPGFDRYGMYRKGSVYASALWDCYLNMGGNLPDPDDRLRAAGEITVACLEALLAVGDNGPVEELVKGLISSDLLRNGGRNEAIIRRAFTSRGLELP